jgi:K+-sensing histidine kinase KdpD
MAGAPVGDEGNTAARGDLWLLANHDFRQPAQTLAFLAAGLAGRASRVERQEQAAGIALMAASLEAMVDMMTLIARYDNGHLTADPVRLALAELLGPLTDRMSSLARQNGRRLEVGGLDATVQADAELVHRIATGMLIYAIKHADKPEIAVRVRTRRAHVALEVCYFGPDPEKALGRMAFVELAPMRTAPGVPVIGLGPALAARLAMHAGLDLEPGVEPSGGRHLALLMPKGRRPA